MDEMKLPAVKDERLAKLAEEFRGVVTKLRAGINASDSKAVRFAGRTFLLSITAFASVLFEAAEKKANKVK